MQARLSTQSWFVVLLRNGSDSDASQPPKGGLSSAQKQALCVQWIQRSGVAHALKDLEKALPAAASIHPAAVKDFIQVMTDERLIRVEKIGSGNWYWSFLSDEKVRREQALAKAEGEKDKVQNTIGELQAKLEEAAAAREEDEDEMLMDPGMDRKSMTKTHGELNEHLRVLRTELAGYSENDPVEVERRKGRILEERMRVESLTDAIYSMEGWFKQQLGGDKAQLLAMKQSWYGDEFEADAGGLREI